MPTTVDRANELLSKATLFTGIDFIQVEDACEQTELRVFFLTDPTELTLSFDPTVMGSEALAPENIRIYSPRGEAPDVPVVLADGETHLRLLEDPETTRWYLEVLVREPGDFTDYALRITDPADPSRFDPFFNDTAFSFKAGCDDGLDCLEQPPLCPEEPAVDFPVDYLARDFVSLRNALLDFAAQRYPDWQLPIEADVGTMLLELMAALGDELSYVQDRYNREAYLETATERRSLRNKARLLDYEIHDGRLATTVLDVTVDGVGVLDDTPVDLPVLGGTVWAPTDTGPPVPFEVGVGFLEVDEEEGTDFQLRVKKKWNLGRMKPSCFDDSQACLEVGATEITIDNEISPGGALFIDFSASEEVEWPNRLVMLRSLPPTESGRSIRTHIVRVVEVVESSDPLFDKKLAIIRWAEEDALPFQMCLEEAEFELSGNIVPAIAGETRSARFLVGDGTPEFPGTVEREGPLDREGIRAILHRFSLPDTDTMGLGFRDVVGNLRTTAPQVRLYQLTNVEDEPIDGGSSWRFERSLMLSSADDQVYTLEDGTWRRIVGYHRKGFETVHRDYATGAGYTIRFPDGVFGRTPDRGDAFGVLYKTGPGRRANVPAGTIVKDLPGMANALGAEVVAVTNPLAVTNGADPEANEDIRALTPQAYKAVVNFAVRPEDYGTQAERLPFVQRAQGTLRWTGSWHTMQVAVDPRDRPTMSEDQRDQMDALMACVRQAGREVVVLDPKFLNLDLKVHVCLERFAFPGQVIPRIVEVLVGRRGFRPIKGFFHPDHFTFGTPLRRSSLEAVIHDVPGVHSVTRIEVRPHGFQDFQDFDDLVFPVASDQVIRVENDPLRPERGSVNVMTVGGA